MSASYFEQMIPQLAASDDLIELRELDKLSQKLATEISAEEDAVIKVLKESKNDPSLDDGSITAKTALIEQKRTELMNMMDRQLKKATELYDRLDGCINNLDQEIRSINCVVTDSRREVNRELPPNKRKKKKNLQEVPEPVDIIPIAQNGHDTIDPNEPVYCTCRRVSFGKMVACENSNCDIEWYHYECVGLTEEFNSDQTKWVCPTCSEIGNIIDNNKSQFELS